jgi:hypothetical protein
MNAKVTRMGFRHFLHKSIRRYMQSQFLNRSPGERCFDYDEFRMQQLQDFIQGTGDRDDVRDHLMNCCRCRYVYSVVSKSMKESEELE